MSLFTFYSRYDYQVYQWTGSIFFRRCNTEKISTQTIDRLDFCRVITPPKTGNRIKDNPVPRFRLLRFTAKSASLVRRLLIAFAGRCPAPRPFPKNKIGQFHALSYFLPFLVCTP
jgi:hypothetical protein